MVYLKNRYHFKFRFKLFFIYSVVFSVFFSSSLWALKIVPLLVKEKVDGLLYTNDTGTINYYEQGNHTLYLAKNSKRTELLNFPDQIVQYSVVASSSKKKIIITVTSNQLKANSVQLPRKFYISDFGGENLIELGSGLNPNLHLDDSWVSYYQPEKHKIILKFLPLLQSKTYEILLNTQTNTYYRPKIQMLNNETALYTDLNKTGEEALISYNLLNKSFIFLNKTPNSFTRLDFCLINQDIYLGSFAEEGQGSAEIYKILLGAQQILPQKSLLYQSSGKHLRRLICSERENGIYFIRHLPGSEKSSISQKSSLNFLALVSQNTTKKSAPNISEASFESLLSQIFSMDNKILLVAGGTTYVVAH